MGETIGLWFVQNKLTIPVGKEFAAFMVYQFSIFSCIVKITQIPYNAIIIAYEKMYFFAKISLFEAFLKLIVVYLIISSPIDKLIFYSGLMPMVILIVNLQYYIYCKRTTTICNFYKYWDKAGKGIGDISTGNCYT